MRQAGHQTEIEEGEHRNQDKNRFLQFSKQINIIDFIFDMVGGAKVKQLVKNGINWKRKTKRLSVLRT